jgi:hypothetical protein
MKVKLQVVALAVLLAVGLLALTWVFRPAAVFYLLYRVGLTAPVVIGQSEMVMAEGWFVHRKSEGKYSSEILGPQFQPKPNITLTKVGPGNLDQANQIIVTDLSSQSPSGCSRSPETPEVSLQKFAWGTAVIPDPEKAVVILPDYCLGIASPTGDRTRLREALGEIITIRPIRQ